MSDLLKAKRLNIFESLFNQFAEDLTRYEAKLYLILKLLPLMTKQVSAKFMKTIENVLMTPGQNSFIRCNLNPLRIGLLLYRVLDEVYQLHNYSKNSTDLMKTTLVKQMEKVLNIYNNPLDMMIMVEQTDYEGNDCFWYLDEYDLYPILDCRIMDLCIIKKWTGKYDLNCTIFDYSTSFTLIEDKNGLFANDRVFYELN